MEEVHCALGAGACLGRGGVCVVVVVVVVVVLSRPCLLPCPWTFFRTHS